MSRSADNRGRDVHTPRSGVLHELASIGSRAATASLRPLSKPVGAAAGAGIDLQRRAVDRLLESRELEQVLESPRLQAVVRQILDSDGAKVLIDAFFESGLFERFVDRLLASDALWHLVDEIAGSPAVLAAVSQQGLGMADQVGSAVRTRSRRADDRVEAVARRLIRRRSAELET